MDQTDLIVIAEEGPDRTGAVVDYIMAKVMDGSKWPVPFIPNKYFYLPDWMSLHGLMLIFASLFLLLFFVVLYKRDQLVPSGLTNALELLVIFIRDQICIAALGSVDGRRMTPIFCSFFFFLLMLNIMGLIPIFAGATANLSVTAAMGTSTLFFMIFGAIQKNGVKGFLHAFMPPGVPGPILALLMPIEMIGMLIKSMALTIRLFANMLAGSIVLYMIIGLLVIFGPRGIPSLLLGVMIYGLKIVVAFLQAYIFTMLSAIFIGQTMNPEH